MRMWGPTIRLPMWAFWGFRVGGWSGHPPPPSLCAAFQQGRSSHALHRDLWHEAEGHPEGGHLEVPLWEQRARGRAADGDEATLGIIAVHGACP